MSSAGSPPRLPFHRIALMIACTVRAAPAPLLPFFCFTHLYNVSPPPPLATPIIGILAIVPVGTFHCPTSFTPWTEVLLGHGSGVMSPLVWLENSHCFFFAVQQSRFLNMAITVAHPVISIFLVFFSPIHLLLLPSSWPPNSMPIRDA